MGADDPQQHARGQAMGRYRLKSPGGVMQLRQFGWLGALLMLTTLVASIHAVPQRMPAPEP